MIVLDTNALMMPVECDVRLFEELERVGPSAERSSADSRVARDRDGPSDRANGPEAREQTAEPRDADETYLVPDSVRAELAKLADGNGAEATAAAVGLDLLERCSVVETTADYADDAVLELAGDDDVTHAVTNDKPLKRRLLDAGVPVISLRGGNKLGITQP